MLISSIGNGSSTCWNCTSICPLFLWLWSWKENLLWWKNISRYEACEYRVSRCTLWCVHCTDTRSWGENQMCSTSSISNWCNEVSRSTGCCQAFVSDTKYTAEYLLDINRKEFLGSHVDLWPPCCEILLDHSSTLLDMSTLRRHYVMGTKILVCWQLFLLVEWQEF